MNFILLDTETTGLTQAKACEIGWLQLDANFNILDEQCYRTDPQKPIETGATEIHGIHDSDVRGKPSNADICAKLPQPFVWIGHNCSYDIRVIGEHVIFNGDLCTLALSRRFVQGTTNHKLDTLKVELGLKRKAGLSSHSALGDCHSTRELLLHVANLTGKNLAELVELESVPKMLLKMPFGKHRGLAIKDIPKEYRNWLMGLPDLHKDLRYTLEKVKVL